jgi:hypothetical protein
MMAFMIDIFMPPSLDFQSYRHTPPTASDKFFPNDYSKALFRYCFSAARQNTHTDDYPAQIVGDNLFTFLNLFTDRQRTGWFQSYF